MSSRLLAEPQKCPLNRIVFILFWLWHDEYIQSTQHFLEDYFRSLLVRFFGPIRNIRGKFKSNWTIQPIWPRRNLNERFLFQILVGWSVFCQCWDSAYGSNSSLTRKLMTLHRLQPIPKSSKPTRLSCSANTCESHRLIQTSTTVSSDISSIHVMIL